METHVKQTQRLQTYEVTISKLVGERVHFKAIDDMTMLRRRYADQIFKQTITECGPLKSLGTPAAISNYIACICKYMRYYLPMFAACRVREVVFHAHAGVPLDLSFISRHVSTCIDHTGVLEMPHELDRVAESVCNNSTREVEAANAYGTPLVELMQSIFIQDEYLFTLLWSPFAKWIDCVTRGHTVELLKKHMNTSESEGRVQNEDMIAEGKKDGPSVFTSTEMLSLLASVCAHHGTHAMTLQVARYIAENGYDHNQARFIDFIARYGTMPSDHRVLSRTLFHLRLISPNVLLKRATTMIPRMAARPMVSVLLWCSVDYTRKLSNQNRGMNYRKWTENYTADTYLSTLENTEHLDALGQMWIVALTQKPNSNDPFSHNVCFLCDGVELHCGALLHIGLRLLELNMGTFDTREHTHTSLCDMWRIACTQPNKHNRDYMLKQMWTLTENPCALFANERKLRGRLSHSAIGLLVHYRCYSSMHTFTALKPLPIDIMLPIALCREALADNHLAHLHTLIHTCLAPATSEPFLNKTWLLEIARVYQQTQRKLDDVYNDIHMHICAQPFQLFQCALRLGLPNLAALTFSGDPSDVLTAYLLAIHDVQPQPQPQHFQCIHPKCHNFCMALEPELEISMDALYDALGEDDLDLMVRLISVAPWLVTEAPSTEKWTKLKRKWRPWCNKRRSQDSYRKLPTNMFVAAMRLRRTACTNWFLEKPALLSTLAKDPWGHSVFCEAAWLDLAHVCRALYHTGAIPLGACERLCCPTYEAIIL